MYKKVILPVRGEAHGQRASLALERALKLCDGEIVLLHVTEPVAQTVGGEAREELQREKAEEGLLALAPIIEKLESAGVPFHTRVVSGTPAETIVQVADEEKADLIVMFTDGRDDLTDFLFGSITERVLRSLDVDLLAVHGKIEED